MSKYKEAESKKDEKKPLYTEDDDRRFCEAMKGFTGNKRINDTLYSPFERYLAQLGVISFKEIGRFTVHDALGFTKLNAMNSRYELREYHKEVEFLQQNPEAKTAFQQRIAKMREQLHVKMHA